MSRLVACELAQFTYLVCAGVGAGKTFMAAWLAAEMLRRGVIERIVYVCPNRIIQYAVKEAFASFGIHLVVWANKRHGEFGEPSSFRGAIITYHSLSLRPDIQRSLCGHHRTMVIFDEIHHLGDNLSWSEAARVAFEGAGAARIILGLSGTPYRSDNREIPFVAYLAMEGGLRKFKADFSYSLGESVFDAHCREPLFRWLDAEVEVVCDGSKQTKKFSDDVSEETANKMLSAAVAARSLSRRSALKAAIDECAAEGRKLSIFVGGDTNSDDLATEDAESILPAEIISLGVDPKHILSITSKDSMGAENLRMFGKSAAKYLISVNMFSEGADVPELSAALFLTSITSKQTTVQRIGRVLRGSGTALVFMFRHPGYMELAAEIKKEIEHEFNLRKPREEKEPRENGEPKRKSDAVGLNGWADGMTFNGKVYSESDREWGIEFLKKNNLQCSNELIAMALAVKDGEK